jgi:hypothetical protein
MLDYSEEINFNGNQATKYDHGRMLFRLTNRATKKNNFQINASPSPFFQCFNIGI